MSEATKRPWTAHILYCPKDRIGQYVQQCVNSSGGDDFYFISAPHPDGGDADVAHVGNGPKGKYNAALIVRAVNTFDQAREARIAELEVECKKVNAELKHWTFDLFKRTETERDAAVQRAERAEARVKELEKECAGLAAGSCEAPYGDDYGNKRCKTIDQLQATLAERERDIAKLKAELNETFVDEKETVWTRPTAWAYAMVCKARDKHEQEAGRMRNNVELMARDMCSMPSDLYQEWLDSDSQVHFRQWLAERALKGDE